MSYRSTKGPPAAPPAGKYSAARSHVMNDKYMDDFEKAWEQLHSLNVGGGPGGPGGPAGRRGEPGMDGGSLAAQQRSIYAALEDPSDDFVGGLRGGTGPSYPSSRAGPGPGPSAPGRLPPGRTAGGSVPSSSSVSAARSTAAAPSQYGRASPYGSTGSTSPPGRTAPASAVAASGGDWRPTGLLASRYPARVAVGWQSGPTDPSGVLCDLSDRPNTCSAADWARGEVVVGSTDHALYVLDVVKGVRKRTLYNKSCGHTEWVTCVAYCPDGKIVSGGMDSKLWMWPAGSTRGMVMEAHFGPISQVKYDPSSGLVVSASYDKTLRLWQLGARAHETGCLQGHEAPVLEAEVGPGGRIVSGDRSGHILLWDTGSGGVSWRIKNVHVGHVTALAWFDPAGSRGSGADADGGGGGPHAGCFVSGGQDGVVRVWDARARTNVAKVQLHVNEHGKGAVGDLVAGGGATGGMVVSAGADGTCRALDPRMGFALASTAQLTDFPYSMTVAGGTAAVGCGDGSIHFIDIQSGRTLFALGANRAAVRCMEATYDRLLCSGDDGKAILYNFA